MGAWGYGMRDNDSALDYIAGFQKQAIRHLHEEIIKWKKFKRYRREALDAGANILGLAEVYLDAKLFDYLYYRRATNVISGLKLILAHQLTKGTDDWKKPWQRRKSLLAFRDRLDQIES